MFACRSTSSPLSCRVRQVGPCDDITKLSNDQITAARPRASFGATARGMLSGEQYAAGGRQMEACGFAKVFGNRVESAVEYVNGLTGQGFASFKAFEECAHDMNCEEAFGSDIELVGKNVTITSVIRTIEGPKTTRCHAHKGIAT